MVLLQYPIVLVLFVLCALAVAITRWRFTWGFPAALILGAAMVLSALICALPMAEILLLLLLLLLECCILYAKEGQP